MAEQEEIRFLREQNKDLTMRLSAIKVIVSKITPICSDKLQQLLETCEGCHDDE